MKAKPTVLWLMALVAVAAVGLVALRENDAFWTGAILTLTVLGLCTAGVVAAYQRGSWAGFAFFGWATFYICQPHIAPTNGPALPPLTVACRLLQFVQPKSNVVPASYSIYGTPIVMTLPDGSVYLVHAQGGTPSLLNPVPYQGIRAFLCLWSLAAGLVGAIVGGFVDRRLGSREAPANSAERPASPVT